MYLSSCYWSDNRFIILCVYEYAISERKYAFKITSELNTGIYPSFAREELRRKLAVASAISNCRVIKVAGTSERPGAALCCGVPADGARGLRLDWFYQSSDGKRVASSISSRLIIVRDCICLYCETTKAISIAQATYYFTICLLSRYVSPLQNQSRPEI